MAKQIKYSKGFDRDWDFYIKNINVFTFCGTSVASSTFKFEQDKNGYSAKEAFYHMESSGRKHFESVGSENGGVKALVKTKHPLLCERIFLVKSGINFMIKQWAEGRVDGTLPLVEFSKKRLLDNIIEKHRYRFCLNGNNKLYIPIRDLVELKQKVKKEYSMYLGYYTIEYKRLNESIKVIKHRDIVKQYSLPDWVIEAVENQKSILAADSLSTEGKEVI